MIEGKYVNERQLPKMIINKSYKTELDPNNVQKTMFEKHAGCARFAYNWALSLLKESYEKQKADEQNHFGKKVPTAKQLQVYRKKHRDEYIRPSAITLHKLLIEKKHTEFPWMKEVSKWSPQNALRNVEEAYKRFFKKQSQFPQFKKKGKRDSFTVDAPTIVLNKYVKLPKIGKVRLKESGYIPEGKPKSATISKRADKWFVSIMYEVEIEQKEFNNDVLGVDLGIKSLAICSDGAAFINSTKLKQLEKSLKRQQRRMSRQKKGSNSRKITTSKIGKLHFRISNSRKDLLNKTTSTLVKTKPEGTIVLEDLNVKGMMKNHKLAKAIANAGLYEFKRQIEYKSKWFGKTVKYVDRFFPSSKLCSSCGQIKHNLKLSDRVYTCDCGNKIDRDLNAAINLWNSFSTVSYTGIYAGGDKRFIESSDSRCLSVKPEENIKSGVCYA